MNDPPTPRTLTLTAPVAAGDDAMSGSVVLRIGGTTLAVAVTVPAGAVPLFDILPVVQGLADAVVADGAAAAAAAAGTPVTCGMRCAACCYQAVPITRSEARGLAATVAAMDPERRARVEARFAVARASAATLRAGAGTIDPDNAAAFGLAYLAMHIACPFLEDRLCSIYADRPLLCREHLVTSPPVECDTPATGRVVGVDLPAHVARAFRRVDAQLEGRDMMLIADALDWVAAHPADARHSGPALVQAVFAQLAEAERA